ncbi:MAG: DUF1858 domain-containing protein [Lachnospiraceae bacterium]|nr:DUF1858 domain-containing protein [Lachnospiraceae bacterium]MDD3659767.1 DUF1858 domain-containing protein [Lachnospiraceae bacterium]
MSKIIDLRKSVFEICQEYPELPDLLFELGFHDIVKPGMLHTAGRFMTIPKGAAMKKIDLEHIKSMLEDRGFQVTGFQEKGGCL